MINKKANNLGNKHLYMHIIQNDNKQPKNPPK